MQPREIILANVERRNPPRPGLTFDRGRIDDILSCSLSAHGFQQRRWIEGKREYYDDEWGNIWMRMVDGSRGGEIFKPAIEDWRQLDDMRVPDYTHPDCAATHARDLQPADRQVQAGIHRRLGLQRHPLPAQDGGLLRRSGALPR